MPQKTLLAILLLVSVASVLSIPFVLSGNAVEGGVIRLQDVKVMSSFPCPPMTTETKIKTVIIADGFSPSSLTKISTSLSTEKSKICPSPSPTPAVDCQKKAKEAATQFLLGAARDRPKCKNLHIKTTSISCGSYQIIQSVQKTESQADPCTDPNPCNFPTVACGDTKSCIIGDLEHIVACEDTGEIRSEGLAAGLGVPADTDLSKLITPEGGLASLPGGEAGGGTGAA